MFKIPTFEKIQKEITIPADKSISHRALIIGSLVKGKIRIKNFLISKDTLATLECLKKVGVNIKLYKNREVLIQADGMFFKRKKEVSLNACESGTTMRILSGVLVGQKFPVFFDAEKTLRNRPMKRITQPLRLMGAKIEGRKKNDEEYPPLKIQPAKLVGIKYDLPVASAQVKSAIILASLFAEGTTRIKEKEISRDHTERMLSFFQANIKKRGRYIFVEKGKLKNPGELFIPADISSASFFIALATLLENSEITIKDVSINPTRLGFINILKRMGAKIKIINKKRYFEPYADIVVKSSPLKGVKVKKEEIPLMIDEVPLLFVCAAYASGKTEVEGLKELKVKETDRIHSMVYNLKKTGVNIEAFPDIQKEDWKVKIEGIKKMESTCFKSFSDHRTAMSLIIFGIASGKEFFIDDIQCINKSFPEFISLINSLKS